MMRKLTWQTITTLHKKDLKILDLCNFEMTCRQLEHDLFKTCSWLGRDLHKTQHDLDISEWLHHDLNKTCKWLGLDIQLINVTEINPIDIILSLATQVPEKSTTYLLLLFVQLLRRDWNLQLIMSLKLRFSKIQISPYLRRWFFDPI